MKALDLLPDGTVTVRDGERIWSTRRPTIGEWRTLVEATQALDDRATEIEAMEDPDSRTAARQVFTLSGGYASMMAQVLETLGDGRPVDPQTLPVWCTSPDPLRRIFAHWRAVPLDLSSPPTNGMPPLVETDPIGSVSPPL